MKPNLFRSIFNALAEEIHLFPYIRQSFFGLFLFALLFILIGYTGENLKISVQPTESSSINKKMITNYGSDTVLLRGQLVITDPSISQKLILSNSSVDIDLLTLIFICIISIIMIRGCC